MPYSFCDKSSLFTLAIFHRHPGIALIVRTNMTDSWKRHMGGCYETTGCFCIGKLFRPLRCCCIRIDVKLDRNFGLRKLNRGDVQNIAPKLDTLAFAFHPEETVPGRMSWCGTCSNPR